MSNRESIPVDTPKDMEYTAMQLLETIRRAIVMSQNMLEDHKAPGRYVEVSFMSKFRDVAGWILEAEPDTMHGLLKLALRHPDRDMMGVLELYRASEGKTREGYRSDRRPGTSGGVTRARLRGGKRRRW